MTCESTVLLEDVEEGGCRASLRGTLRIDLPLIGKKLQQVIMSAAVEHHRMLPQIFERCACMAPGLHWRQGLQACRLPKRIQRIANRLAENL